jgi:type II secretory pathway pseudopilin PulG
MPSLRSLRRRLSSEEGSLLIEVLVTASILLTLSAGVVLALQTAHAQTGLQRAKALATDVAQNRLDALRTKAYNNLRGFTESVSVPEGGITFTVVSTATPVAQTDAPSGCSNQRARDYMSLKTTVTWPKMGARKPVVLDTLIAAPVGAGGGLLVNVTGAAGQAVPGIPLVLSSGGGSATTDASGCARWDTVSAGTGYGVTGSAAGYVKPDGDPNIAISGIAIVPEDTAQQSIAYDRGGSVSVRFRQRLFGSSTATDITDPTMIPDTVTLSNAAQTVNKDVVGATGGLGTAGLFYPNPTSPYSLYADNCTAAQPTTPAPPAVTIVGGSTANATLELPSLNVKVSNGAQALPTDIAVRIRTTCGTIITNRTVSTANGTLTNPGMPWGSGYQICVSSASAGKRARLVGSGMDNKTYAAPGGTGVQTLTLATNSSTNGCTF